MFCFVFKSNYSCRVTERSFDDVYGRSLDDEVAISPSTEGILLKSDDNYYAVNFILLSSVYVSSRIQGKSFLGLLHRCKRRVS